MSIEVKTFLTIIELDILVQEDNRVILFRDVIFLVKLKALKYKYFLIKLLYLTKQE